MSLPALDQRRADVLRALIQIHVATGEPVGSESLSRAFNRALSPATIRNMLAELEKLGYLQHPHTSAGRMPTDEGYRVYVDSLMSHWPLPHQEADAIESGLASPEDSPGQALANASRLLSRLSRNVAFVLAPDIAGSRFRHLDLVPLPYPRVLAVMVSHTGLVTNKVIELDERLTQDELQACANYLNAHYAGLPLAEIRERLLVLMSEEKALYDSLLKRVVSVGERAFSGEDGERDVYLDGTSHMLGKPELGDPDRVRALFEAFEEKGRLVKILNACISGNGIRVIIGHEIPEPDFQDLALVTAGSPSAGTASWGVGVMGSTRMEYARSVALVDHVARALARVLDEMPR